MKKHTTICDKCGNEIEEQKVWVLKCPSDYKGIDYDLCFSCVDIVMDLHKSGSLGDVAKRMSRE